MSKKFLQPINKVMEAIGLVDGEDAEEELLEEEETDEDENYDQPDISGIGKNNKVVSIKSSNLPRVILKKPVEFQDMMEIIDSVKSKRMVVMNISDVDFKLAQRMVDYIVGACYALNGSFQEITKYIYIFAPENVEITSEFKGELDNESFFSI